MSDLPPERAPASDRSAGEDHQDEGARTVVVFGSSRCAEDSAVYRLAYELGQALASAGFTVCTGGYAGTMTAATRGAQEAGGRTVGIAMALFTDRTPNAWLDEVVVAPTPLARLDEFLRRGDAFVLLPGGVGTLLELGMVWNLRQLGALGARPVILLGEWSAVLRALQQHTFVRAQDVQVLRVARTPADVLRLLGAEPGRQRRTRWPMPATPGSNG